jgi:hypothetical protein
MLKRALLVRGLSWAAGLFVVAFVIIWLSFYSPAASRFFDACNSPQWPHIRGRIIESTVIGEYRGRKPTRATYQPNVVVRYTLDSRHYNCCRIKFDADPSYWHESQARSVIDRYPLHGEVDVYYKPDDPRQSVLEPGASSYIAAAPVAGVILALFFLFFFVRALLRRRTPRPA